ncbi:HD domain-containing protein [Nonomuraea sp. CA-218870]|uniref:HD domain-containing protein n=1 Tax=Nonomuraea sp. CA-218870 TaxID=3239998 RepID=UPI003D91D987
MSWERDVEFLFEIGTMRHVVRTWHQFGGVDFANLAEHSLRVGWLAMIIAQREGGDVGKVLQMAVLHDLAETRTGDVNYLTRMYVERGENEAFADSARDTSLEKQLVSLWEEYEMQETLEAKIVKDADNLDCDLELAEKAAIGVTIAEKLKETRESVFSLLRTPSARELFRHIWAAEPHSWHLNGRNRMTMGDWKK